MSLPTLNWNGLSVSRIAMGCEPLGGTDWGEVDISLARKAVQHALDSGITVFDTADVYGLGRGEKELASALGSRRKDAFVITKFGVRWEHASADGRARTLKDSSPAYLREALEASLRRLKLDAIPLYLVHWPDAATPIEDTLEELEKAKAAGNILNYGLSNFDAATITAMAGKFAVSAIENSFNLLEAERQLPLFAGARNSGAACLAYGTLAQGLLSGKYDENSRFDVTDRRHRLPHFSTENWARNRSTLAELRRVAVAHNKTPAQTAIRWVLDCGLIDVAIVGAKSPDQVDANLGAAGWALAQEDVERLAVACRAAKWKG